MPELTPLVAISTGLNGRRLRYFGLNSFLATGRATVPEEELKLFYNIYYVISILTGCLHITYYAFFRYNNFLMSTGAFA
jgi:hypothetical protein